MGIRETYAAFGGDFDSVLQRLMKEDRIEKYFNIFMADSLMDDLNRTYAEQDWEPMFRAAHTMKGNAQTLGLTDLQVSSSNLTEALRANDYTNVEELLAKVNADYQAIADAVGQ